MGPSSSDLLSLAPGRQRGQTHLHVPNPAPTSGRLASSTEPAATPPAAAPSRSGKPSKRSGGAAPALSSPSTKKDQPKHRPLALDVAAVADVEGLAQEVRFLRAAIRRLAESGDAAADVKVLAELRHQVEALCRALRTQQSLDGHDGDALAAELAQTLEELGDGLGVPQ